MQANPFDRARITSRHRLMVISAKGGVGKSTMTVNLAAALAARGLKVGIFDADVHGPNIPALLGISRKQELKRDASGRPDPRDMFPIEARLTSPDMRPIKPFERYGLKVMSLALRIGEEQAIQPIAQEIGRMVTMLFSRVDWDGADVILLDMPPGTGEPLHSILDADFIDGALLVTTREQLAHLDNGRLLAILRERNIPIVGIVENMTHVVCPKCGELVQLYPAPAENEAVYGDTPVLASVPFHPDLIRQVRGGAPLPLAEPESLVAQMLITLGGEVMTRLERLHSDKKPNV